MVTDPSRPFGKPHIPYLSSQGLGRVESSPWAEVSKQLGPGQQEYHIFWL